MIENFRRFVVGPDPFGRQWQVEFEWQQNGITIRHSDSIDVKFKLHQDGTVCEKVVAMMHPDLLAISRKVGRPITDAWVLKLGALHIRHMIETDEDMDKTLVTASLENLERHNILLQEWTAEQAVQR
jgi:hypothetical protein